MDGGNEWDWVVIAAMAIPPVIAFVVSFLAFLTLNKAGWLPNIHVLIVYAYFIGSVLAAAAIGAGVAVKP